MKRPHANPSSQEATRPHFKDTVPSDALTAVSEFDETSRPPTRTGPYQRVHLRTWPEMRRLAADTLPTVARICALIARRPTPAYLVAARLHEPTETILGLLDDLRDQGHVEADAGVLSLPFALDGKASRAAKSRAARG